MADQRTMAKLLQAPTEGYEIAIVVSAILEENFELKYGLLNLVTSKQFYGHDKEDPHAHIRCSGGGLRMQGSGGGGWGGFGGGGRLDGGSGGGLWCRSRGVGGSWCGNSGGEVAAVAVGDYGWWGGA
nr:reverse transcriptase domain-containing protein [Tanacetum cinerariifolium]